LVAACKDDEVLSDSEPLVVTEQKEGDFEGDLDIVGLTVKGLEVGTLVGNFEGALLGVMVGLEAKNAKELSLPSRQT